MGEQSIRGSEEFTRAGGASGLALENTLIHQPVEPAVVAPSAKQTPSGAVMRNRTCRRLLLASALVPVALGPWLREAPPLQEAVAVSLTTASAAPKPASPSSPAVAPSPPRRYPDAPANVARPTSTAEPPPTIKTIHVALVVPVDQVQAAIDRCTGVVEYQWGPTPPILIEHDYCGGYNLVNVRPGQSIRIIGGGLDGVYTYASVHEISDSGPVAQVRSEWGGVVLVTCDGPTTEVAVGLSRRAA